MKMIILLILTITLSLILINAYTYDDCNVYGTCSIVSTPSSVTINYSTLNVSTSNYSLYSNNTNFLQGLNATQLPYWNLNATQYVGASQRKYGSITFADINNRMSIDVGQRRLYDNSASPKLSVDYNTRQMLDSSNNNALLWNAKYLYSDGAIISHDWNHRLLYDNNSIPSIDHNVRQAISSDGTNNFDWNSPNGTYFFKNVDIRGDVARLDDTALFVQSPDRVDTCIGDITSCTDLNTNSCSYFSGCSMGECQGNPSLDCTTFNEADCNYYNSNFNMVCGVNSAYFDTCRDISTQVSCDSANGYGCYWNTVSGAFCDAYDGSAGSCGFYDLDETNCLANSCVYNSGSGVCTQNVGNYIFTDCSNYGSCEYITDSYYCDSYITTGCAFNINVCVGSPSSTSCNQIGPETGNCIVEDTNGYCSIETSNDFTTHVDRAGVGQTKNAYECQASDGSVITSIDNTCGNMITSTLTSNSGMINYGTLLQYGQLNSYNNIYSYGIYPASNNNYQVGGSGIKWQGAFINHVNTTTINATTSNITTINNDYLNTRNISATNLTSSIIYSTNITLKYNETSYTEIKPISGGSLTVQTFGTAGSLIFYPKNGLTYFNGPSVNNRFFAYDYSGTLCGGYPYLQLDASGLYLLSSCGVTSIARDSAGTLVITPDPRSNLTRIQKNLEVNGSVNITNNLSVSSERVFNNFTVDGNVYIGGNLSVKRPYFNGYDNSTQALLNVANAQVINITNNPDNDSYLIKVVNRQNLTFEQTGDYICTLSPEFYEPAGQSGVITFWMQKNGVDVPWSNSRYTLASNTYNAPSITYQFDIDNPATENIRFMWWSDNGNTVLYSSGVLTSPTRPSIPAILINCQKASEITP